MLSALMSLTSNMNFHEENEGNCRNRCLGDFGLSASEQAGVIAGCIARDEPDMSPLGVFKDYMESENDATTMKDAQFSRMRTTG